MTGPGAPAAHPTVPGHTVLSARALHRVSEAAAAAELRVPVREVRVRIADADGLLGLGVSAPAALPKPARWDRADELTVTCERSRVAIAARVEALTGRQVGRCELTVVGALFPPERRVR